MARTKGSKNRPKDEIAREKAEKASGRKTGAASPPAAAAAAGPGHNSELTEGEKQSRLIIGLAEIEKFNTEKNSVVAKIRNERKRLQSFGFTTAEIDFALKLRADKPEDAVARWNALRRVASFLSHPIGTQSDLFGGGTSAKQSKVERAGEGGYTAGLEGKECKPPYDAASPEGQMWMERWHAGAAERTKAFVQATNGDATDKAAGAFEDSIGDAANGRDPPPSTAAGAEPHPMDIPTELRQPAAAE